LGTIFTKDGRDSKNIRHRLTQARKIIGALNQVWWSKNITRNREKIIYNSMVKSVLIYGAETWSLYKDDRKRINATDMDALTLILLMCRIGRAPNSIPVYSYIQQDVTLHSLFISGNCSTCFG
jgi:hypothetical protein